MPDASVAFSDGLNVISGPSDTGKSYVLQCIDYALGAGTPPEKIPEANGYTDICLTIETRDDGSRRAIRRALAGGGAKLASDGEASRTLKAKHRDGDTGTISGYLLRLADLAGRRVLTASYGRTRGLSFRDIARMTIIDEEAVITKQSPIYGRRLTDRTVEERVFRMLLTGEDDASVVNEGDPKTARARRAGQEELLEGLLRDLEAERNGRSAAGFTDVAAAEERLDELERLVREARASLETERQAATALEEQRLPIWRSLRETESRMQFLEALQSRFTLLDAQYESDLRRLAATAEAGARLVELAEERCPVCGAQAEHHDRDHAENTATPDDVVLASRAESNKIQALQIDLRKTISGNADDIASLAELRARQASQLEAVERTIKEELQPRLSGLIQAYRAAEVERQQFASNLQLAKRERKLRELLERSKRSGVRTSARRAHHGVTSAEAELFAQTVERLLRAWHFPSLDRVTFSDESQDIVISGQDRRSRGQGVRALTHAAFTLALLRLSLDEGRPVSGFVVIDSPLVVYQEPDPDEDGFPADVKIEFYRSVAHDFSDAQVVILENERPPEELEAIANLTHFTKQQYGRYGFIPTTALAN